MPDLPPRLAALQAEYELSAKATRAALDAMIRAPTASPAWNAAFDEYIRCSQADSAAWAAFTAARDAWVDERRSQSYRAHRQALRAILLAPLGEAL